MFVAWEEHPPSWNAAPRAAAARPPGGGHAPRDCALSASGEDIAMSAQRWTDRFLGDLSRD
jgi:hypothetical protein